MEISTDIAIIGGGLASYAAALELQEKGKQVTLITKGPGATALSSGAWDIAASSKSFSIRENLAEILQACEFHPYHVLARNIPHGDFFNLIEETMQRAAHGLALPISGDGRKNLGVVSNFGTVRPAAFVQTSMRDADIHGMDRAKVLVVGIQGFPPFNARFISEALLEFQETQTKNHLEFSGQVMVEMPDVLSRASLNAVELALHLDREATFKKFGNTVMKYLDGKVYTHLLLPPVMGVKNTSGILGAMRKITGLKVAETLSAPMSVPGWRLHESIQKYFSDKDVEILEGEAVDFEREGRRIKSLRIHQEEKLYKVKARSFILATGKFIGGGIQKEQDFRETIFGLPVFCQGKVVRGQSVMGLARPLSSEVQPFLSVGVGVNPLCQALDEDQQVAYDNLFAAGSVLTGFDPSHERCRAGVSILSGTIAAQHALQTI
jgi:glycerol-3-phosphate dehydrogenase subunit B